MRECDNSKVHKTATPYCLYDF